MKSKDALFTMTAQFLSVVIGFITSVLNARFLGPAGRGDYFFVTTLALIITQFAHLGLASSNTYLVARQLNLLGKLLVNSFWISLLIGVVVSALTIAGLFVLQIPMPHGTWLLLLLAPASLFYLLGSNLLVGINKVILYNFFQVGSNLLLVSLMLVAGLIGCQVYGFLLVSVLGWVVVALSMLIYLMNFTKQATLGFWFDKACFLQGAQYGFKLYLITLTGMLVLKGNVFLLKYFTTDVSLGYYSIASQLNDCLAILPSSVGLVLFPSLIRNTNDRWQEMIKSLWMIMGVMLFACLAGALLVKPFIQIAFGARFLPAVEIFWCMLPGAFFLGLITIISQYLAAIGCPKLLIAVWLIAFIVVIVSSWLLVPIFAAKGAAISLSIAYFVLFGLIFLLAKKFATPQVRHPERSEGSPELGINSVN